MNQQLRLPAPDAPESAKVYPIGSIGPEKRPWNMPTSQPNSVLETWTHADLSLLILVLGTAKFRGSLRAGSGQL
jgi:hypothetical protein